MSTYPSLTGRLAGRQPNAWVSSSSCRWPHAAVVVAALALSACGGGSEPPVASAPLADPAEFTDGFLVASTGSSNYTPLLQLAGNWQRCENGAQYNVSLAVADAAEGSLRLHSQFVDYFANTDCSGARVARAERVVSGSTTPLEIAVGYTGGTFMSRDYVLPPTNQAADTVFWRVTYTASDRGVPAGRACRGAIGQFLAGHPFAKCPDARRAVPVFHGARATAGGA